MTALLALTGPVIAAMSAAVLRRKVGAWASWILLLAVASFTARFFSSPVWWNRPGFFAEMGEGLGILYGAIVAALLLHQCSRTSPPLGVQIAMASAGGLAVPWLGRWFSQSEVVCDVFLGLCGLWLLGLLVRDGRSWWRRRHPDRSL